MQLLCLCTLCPVLAVFSSSCGHPSRPGSQVLEVPAPLTVVVDSEIKGDILGQTIKSPVGLAVDRRGILYVVDSGNNRLISFDRYFAPVRDIGGYGSQPGQFDRPAYVTVDNDLSLLVSDVGNRRISRHDSKLNYVGEIDLRDDEDPLKFGQPSGVGLTEYGEVWMCDRENNRLAVFDNIGRFDRFVGEFGYSGGELRVPEKIVADPEGAFHVCDAGNSRIAIYDEFGNFLREVLESSFEYPRALAFDKHGIAWVLDGVTGRLFCIDGAGHSRLSVGPLIPGCSEPLNDPSDLVFTGDGRLVISDTGNHRLLVCRVVREDR